ncbi:MAG TPA: ABC transporter substrate-binding protein [Blastocatellia bacterium]|nr:ABC transporter substrate-binding protein [Blastocatellia bacterium]
MKNATARVVIALVLGLLLPLSHSEAGQAKKMSRIGVLHGSSPLSRRTDNEALRDGLRELGWVEGENIGIEWSYAEGNLDRLPDLAAELIRHKVDVIVVSGYTAIRILKNATQTIPVVMTIVGDPVTSGFVNSFARPGGNITGLTSLEWELSGKRLELLKEAFPKVSRVAVLGQPDAPGTVEQFKVAQIAAQELGVQFQGLGARTPDDLETAFKQATGGRAGALMVLGNLLFNANRQRIVNLVAKARLPAMYNERVYVEAGGLMSYAANLTDIFRRAAIYVDKILKGATPSDLPIEQPTKFDFVINLKTAKQLGVIIPPDVLRWADKVIK